MISQLDFSFTGSCTPHMRAEDLPAGFAPISYSLFIEIHNSSAIVIGRLGSFVFPAGKYVYSGSAKKNILARVNRHLRAEKKLRWHVDYLLAAPAASITGLRLSTLEECDLVRRGGGTPLINGFGASDCRAGCISHLRLLTAV